MKKLISIFLIVIYTVMLSACSGLGSVDLKEPMAIPSDGVISRSVTEQIKTDNAIAVFSGKSGDYSYEWTIFGSDISEPREVNLGVEIADGGKNAVKLTFLSGASFGFPAVLSVRLNEKWNVQGATVYNGQIPVCSASVTGSKASVLNFSVENAVGTLMIRADSDTPADTVSTAPSGNDEATPESAQPSVTYDGYLSANEHDDDSIYTSATTSAITPTETPTAATSPSAVSSEQATTVMPTTQPEEYLSGGGEPTQPAVTTQEYVFADKPRDTASDNDYLAHQQDNGGDVYTDKSGTLAVPDNQAASTGADDYLSDTKAGDDDGVYSGGSSGRKYSDGSETEQDEYLTDPIPVGKPLPIEPGEVDIDDDVIFTCTFSIECSTILNNLSELNEEKREVLPTDGIILKKVKVKFAKGESVYDVLQRICEENGIQMEASWTPIYNSAYVEGIHNLYEFDCGSLSGWMYRVNGWYPNYGCSRYVLEQGDVVEWRYTCDLGRDVGCDWLAGS